MAVDFFGEQIHWFLLPNVKLYCIIDLPVIKFLGSVDGKQNTRADACQQ